MTIAIRPPLPRLTGKIHYVMSFSGGLCSWFAARRLVDRRGRENVTLLFADTLMEHSDLYRFLSDASDDLGIPVTRIAEGRTPWQVFYDHRMMGNSMVDMCSQELKRDFLDKYTKEHYSTHNTVRCCGLSNGERGRYVRFRARMRARGWHTEAPAMASPHFSKADMLAAARTRGLEPSDSYEDGFSHDNCGGFCVKAGQRHFIQLLTKRPETFNYHENKEQEFRAFVNKDVSILRDRRGGATKPLTLKTLRERHEAKQFSKIDFADEGVACGCAIDG
jgi:hypothetical protein